MSQDLYEWRANNFLFSIEGSNNDKDSSHVKDRVPNVGF